MQQGMQQGGAAILLRLIERRFGPPSDQVRERISQADPKTLLQWSDRILEAKSLDEVLH
ncbi:transposase [Thiocapsa imhoffii]|uniref:Transposase n=2 Tax=Thiocapsa imhoffii TaxID=382777 RepID=A0A9X0WLF8_9GAMM|nr:transposase [Thiocapsa imhoffii]